MAIAGKVTTPINSGFSIVNAESVAGSNGGRVYSWIEYKLTPSTTGHILRVIVYAKANWNSGTSSGSTKKNFGYVQMNGGTKRYLSTSYNFGYDSGTSTPHLNKFADYTFTIPSGTSSVTIFGHWDTGGGGTPSTYITSSDIGSFTITIATTGVGKLRINSSFVDSAPYICSSNTFKKSTPYVFRNGSWKESI